MSDPRKNTPQPEGLSPDQDMLPNPNPGPKPHDDTGNDEQETYPGDPLSPEHDPRDLPPPMQETT